jgi:hypothetical protein
MSPTTKTSGWEASEQSGVTLTRPARSVRPDRRHRRDRALIAVAVAHRDRLSVEPADRGAHVHLDTQPLECQRRLAREALAERRQDALAGIEQEDPRLRRIERAEVARQGVMGELADLAGQFDACRSGADDRKGQPRRSLLRVGLPLRHLEGPEDPPAQPQRLIDRLHPGSPALERVVAEVRGRHAPGEDQAVVGDRALGRVRAAHGERPGRDVDRGHLPHLDCHVALFAQHVSRGGRDLARGEDAGGHLVEQRREQVAVGPLDQRDVGVGLAQRLGGEQAAEAAADDHHAVRTRGRPWFALS